MQPNGNNHLFLMVFKNIRKYHCQFIISELEARNMPFERTKFNSKGKFAKVGLKIMVSVLRKHAYPNEEEEKKISKIKMKS